MALAGGHLSLYQLTIEPATPFAELYARGKLKVPEGETGRAFYELTQELTEAAGRPAYEISNHAAPGEECRHNLLYWTGGHWWGVGPGAHSHVGGVRWWNVKHPAAYAERLGRGVSPALAREVLGYRDRKVERILLEIRLVEGLPVSALEATGRSHVARMVADGLVELAAERLVLTQRGRLLADAVVRDLVD